MNNTPTSSKKIFVQFPSGETLAYNITEADNINMLKAQICATGIKFSDLSLIQNGNKLQGSSTLENLQDNSTLQALVAVEGGLAQKIDPITEGLATRYRLRKKICRKCYSLLSLKARTCRKRRCGRWADIRPRKALVEKGGK